jgi:hypothetical protein
MFVTLLSLICLSKHHHSKNLMFIFKGTEIFIIVVAFINLLKFVYVSFQDILITTIYTYVYIYLHIYVYIHIYILIDTEIFIIVVAFINLLKFVYVSIQDLLMTKRVPFQDEWEELGIYICIYVYNYVFYPYIYMFNHHFVHSLITVVYICIYVCMSVCMYKDFKSLYENYLHVYICINTHIHMNIDIHIHNTCMYITMCFTHIYMFNHYSFHSLITRGGHDPLHASKPTTHTQNHLNKTNTVIQQ